MLTVTDWKKLLRRFTSISKDDVDDYGLQLINQGRKEVLTIVDSFQTQQTFVASTIAGQQDYALPHNTFKIENVTVLVGSVRYTPEIVTSPEIWNYVRIINTPQSTIPLYVYFDKRKMSFFPIPSADGNTITAIVTLKEPDLTEDDITNGTISVTTGSTTVTGTNTIFATNNTTQNNWQIQMPDNSWYEIASVQSPTSLTLSTTYEGPSATNSEYRMGQVSVIPEDGQMLPVYFAAYNHFLTLEKPDKATEFNKLYVGSQTTPVTAATGILGVKEKYATKVEDTMRVGGNRGRSIRNKNSYPGFPNDTQG